MLMQGGDGFGWLAHDLPDFSGLSPRQLCALEAVLAGFGASRVDEASPLDVLAAQRGIVAQSTAPEAMDDAASDGMWDGRYSWEGTEDVEGAEFGEDGEADDESQASEDYDYEDEEGQQMDELLDVIAGQDDRQHYEALGLEYRSESESDHEGDEDVEDDTDSFGLRGVVGVAPSSGSPGAAKQRWRVNEEALAMLSISAEGWQRAPPDAECSICCQAAEEPVHGSDSDAIALPCVESGCPSYFHEACVRPWLERNPTCPLCRHCVEELVHPLEPSCPSAGSTSASGLDGFMGSRGDFLRMALALDGGATDSPFLELAAIFGGAYGGLGYDDWCPDSRPSHTPDSVGSALPRAMYRPSAVGRNGEESSAWALGDARNDHISVGERTVSQAEAVPPQHVAQQSPHRGREAAPDSPLVPMGSAPRSGSAALPIRSPPPTPGDSRGGSSNEAPPSRSNLRPSSFTTGNGNREGLQERSWRPGSSSATGSTSASAQAFGLRRVFTQSALRALGLSPHLSS